MSKNTSVRGKVGGTMFTRGQKATIKNGKQWVFPKTVTEGRDFLTKRIDSYLKGEIRGKLDDKISKEWKEIVQKGKNDFPNMLNFAVDRLKLQSIRRQENYKRLSNVMKAKFLEPFHPKMEEETWEIISEANPASKPKPSYDKLLKFCINQYKTPMTYSHEQIIKNGKQIWKTTVTHPDSNNRVFGIGEAEDQYDSHDLASSMAVRNLETSKRDIISKTPPTSQGNIVVEEDDDEKNKNGDEEEEKVEDLRLESEFPKENEESDDDSEKEYDNIPQPTTVSIRKEAYEVLEENFKQLLTTAIDSMGDLFDNRIRNVIGEMIDKKLNKMLNTEITKQADAKTAKEIKSAVQEYAEAQITDNMKESVCDAVVKKISKLASDECTTRFKEVKGKIETHEENVMNSIATANTEAVDEITSIHQSKLQSYEKIVKRDKNEINLNRESYKNAMKNQFETHLIQLQNETNEHVSNINEVGQQYKNKAEHTEKYQPMIEFVCNEEVVYKDPITGQQCSAWIADVDDDDEEMIFYTIKFGTGKTRRTNAESISKLTTVENAIPTCNRFANVDISQISPPKSTKPIPALCTPTKSQQILDAPSGLDIKNFHSQFKSPLRSDADIFNFYNQLRSQGKNYNIHLIDINDITKDNDLCPKGVQKGARDTMAMAIYQKLQDENTRDITYKTLENCMELSSATSDGFSVLRELLRKVHPQLKKKEKIHDIPWLSQCDYDLYKLGKHLKMYFDQQEMKGRLHNAKEKAQLFLERLHDDRYKDAKQQCMIDLNIATMQSDHHIQDDSLTFESLPGTIEELAGDTTIPIVRSLTQRNIKNSNYEGGGAYKHNSKSYEPLQYKGCGVWGHKVQKCNNVPKIATIMKFIERNKTQTEALVKEYLKVNDRSTKRNIVRLLMNSGVLHDDITPAEFLSNEDIEVEMDEVEFEVDSDRE